MALCVVCSMTNPVPSDAPAPVPDQDGQDQFLLPYYGYPYVATYKTGNYNFNLKLLKLNYIHFI